MQSVKTVQSFADIDSFLPDGWKLVKNRSIFTERNERNGEEELELLSVTQNQGVIRQSEYEIKKDTSNDDKSNYKKVFPGDIVYNKMRMWQGAVGLSQYKGIVSPAYVVLKPHDNIEPKFFYYLMKTPAYIAQSYSYSYGLCDDMNSLRYEDFRNMLSILPSPSAQKKIVSYLDNKLEKIDLFIDNKIRYIEKLKEQKQAVINKAITKGVDKHAAMKPSENDWLDEIPAHWRLRKLKYCAKLRSESAAPTESPLKIALENIESHTGKYIATESPFEGAGTVFYKGDVLFGKLRPYLSKVLIATSDGACVSDILPIVPNQALITKEFLFFRLISRDFINEVNSSTYGAKMPRASWHFIASLRIPFPKPDEQAEIVNYILEEIALIDKAIDKSQQQIELIKEYKTSLITDAVTGQLNIKE